MKGPESYPSFKRVKNEEGDTSLEKVDGDGNIIKETEEKPELEKEQTKSAKEVKKEVNMARRRFLTMIAEGGNALLAAAVVGPAVLKNESKAAYTQKESGKIDWGKREEQKEEAPDFMTPERQYELYGKIVDVENAARAIEEDHFKHLTETEKGRARLELMDKNRQKLGIDDEEFMYAFEERGLPPDLVYWMAAQESDYNNAALSDTGARGILGFREIAAKDVGSPHEEADIPERASGMAARLFRNNNRYGVGENLDLLIYAYNSGWQLEGFTEGASDEEKTPEQFRAYLMEKMNEKYAAARQKGTSHEKILKRVIDKEIEVLRYLSEIKAKARAINASEDLFVDMKDHLKTVKAPMFVAQL